MTRPFPKRLKNRLIYLLIRSLVEVARRVPRRSGVWLFSMLGRLAFYVPNREKRRALKHLGMVFGSNKSPQEIQRLARSCWGDLSANFFEAVRVTTWDAGDLDRNVIHDDLSPFTQAYHQGKGVIVVTGHIGCFELLLHFFALKGYHSFAIGTRLFDSRINQLVERGRSGERIEYVNRNDVRGMLRLLKEGRAMGVLIDQDTNVDGVFAHFLGRIAYTPSGPVRLAMRFGIPLFVVTTHRLPDGRHQVTVGEPFPILSEGNFNSDLVRNVEGVNARLSEAILNQPSQWVWMHRRWRRLPNDPRFAGVPNIEKSATAP